MKKLLLVLGLLCVGLPLLLAVVVGAALDKEPLVNRAASFTPANIGRAKALLDRNDPRKLTPGVLRTVTVNQQDLDLAVNYLANELGRGSANVVLQDGLVLLRLTTPLPSNPVGAYLNVDAVLMETEALPRFAQLRVGHLPVPAWLANLALDLGLSYLHRRPDLAAAADTVKSITSRNGLFVVVYDWKNELPDQLRSVLVSKGERERIQAYQTRLAEVTRGIAPKGHPALSAVVQPLFQLASQRTASGAGGTAAEENRAAIIVLTFFINGKGIKAIMPNTQDWPVPVPLWVTLATRHDSAQHFIISAALAATAGSPLSKAVGLYKEVADSRGGSGFSFNDLAADRAGTRFGELAIQSDSTATQLQNMLSASVTDATLLPPVADLPEDMQEPEFMRRFGGVDAPAYKQMFAEIERRVASLPLYR